MKIYFQFLLITCISVLLSSCFEIREEVNVKADGSGDIKFVANFSESKDKVRSYMQVGKVDGRELPSQDKIESVIRDAKRVLQGVKGISVVQSSSDWSNYLFTISCRFENAEALNSAIITLTKQLDYLKVPPTEKANYSYDNKQFQRLFDVPAKKKEFNELPSMHRFMLESARMTSVYRFEKNIASFTNKKAKISPSKKAIMLQLPLSELMTGSGTLANNISF